MNTTTNRAARRHAARIEARETKKRTRNWRTSLVAIGAAATVGLAMTGGVGAALADDTPPAPGMSADSILGMLDDEMITGFVEMCRTGALANGNPEAGNSTAWNPEDTQNGQVPPGAIATCTDSTGHGLALVLPERFEIGQLAENMTMDLGDDINLLVVKYKMGERNLFEVLGGVVLGSDTVKGAAALLGMPRVDPGAFDKYKSYDQVRADASLPYVEERYCSGVILFGNCVGGWRYRDANAEKRNEAIKIAEALTGQTFVRDEEGRVFLPAKPELQGRSTIKGEGINLALSMRNGTAFAETGNNLAVALAGADHGQLATAYAMYGIAIAANMDTEDIRFTWFGQDVDFSILKPLLESDMAADAGGAEMGPMLDMISGLNGQIPSIKEVFCFGLNAKATAEGLGSCTNFLGTFDTYKDLRPLSNGSADFTGDSVARQEQYGLTDITSLLFGNDALLKQLAPLLGGDDDMDMNAVLGSPFVQDLLLAVLSEEKRIKLTKDFIRYTKNVETVFEKEPVLDANGDPVTAPVFVEQQAKDADGNLLWVDADGNEVAEDAEGALPKMEQVRKQEQAKDADGNLLWDDAEQTIPTMVDVSVPVMKNKTTARMVGVYEDAWEEYVSDEPLMKTITVSEQARDDHGNLLWNDDDETDPMMIDVEKQVQDTDADGNLLFQTKTRHLQKPVMVAQTDGDGNVVYRDFREGDADGAAVWLDAEGNVVAEGTEGAVKKSPVMVQKMEQAKDSQGNLLWDPVVAKTVTAHWLTSDYGLREPLVIKWLGHEVVFFPAVEVNGTYRPNLIGLPQIRRIADQANSGLLPQISLVQWDNPFGLGTWSFDRPWDLFGTAKNFADSITLHKDLQQIDDLFGITDGIKDGLGLTKPQPPIDPDPVDPIDPDPVDPDVADPDDGTDLDEGDGNDPNGILAVEDDSSTSPKPLEVPTVTDSSSAPSEGLEPGSSGDGSSGTTDPVIDESSSPADSEPAAPAVPEAPSPVESGWTATDPGTSAAGSGSEPELVSSGLGE